MKEMDYIGIKTCAYQAKLFEASLKYTNCSSRIFIRRFMNSDLAKRMDKNTIIFESLDVIDALQEIEDQYGPSSYGKERYTLDELHWIGYIYRYWSYIKNRASKGIYKIVKPEQLRKVYIPYSSLDPLQALDRIVESYGKEEDQIFIDDITRGVIILRKNRYKDSNK